MFQAFRGIVTLTITRQRMMIACVTLLTLAMHAVLMPASAQDLQAIHKRFLQFKAAGNYGDALIEAQILEAAVEARLGSAHPDYAVALHSSAIAYYSLGLYEKAELYYRRALAILETAKGGSHPDLAIALSSLGSILTFKNQYGEAELHYRRALAILEKSKGGSHPDLALPLSNLASVLGLTKQYGEAEEHYRRALAILEKSKGVTHQEVIMPLLGLTNVYAAEGRYEEATGLYKRALAIQRAKGARDPDVAGFGISVPPPQFIGTYKGLVIERVLPRPEMNRECSEFASGCARRAEPDPTTFCVIVIPAIDGLVTPQVQERIRLHEIGHCAGWPADHPGARPGESPHPKQQKFVSSMPASLARQSPTMPSAVVLYEEDPNNRQGNRMIGTVVWQSGMMVPSPGHPAEMTIRADVEVLERKLAMTWLLRRNTNQDLAVTHTIEFMFSVPTDSPFGGIARVPGMLMKQAERTRGVRLSGSSIKVTPTSFLIGLSGLETDAQRNLELLSEWSWLDIPVFYGNGQRAIIAMEKGASGERAFAEAFKAWGEGKRDAHAVPRE